MGRAPSDKIKHKLTSPIIMWLVIWVGIVLSLRFLPSTELWPRTPIGYGTLALAWVYWLIFFLGGILANRQAVGSALSIEELVTTGAYSRVRHPIYSADMVLSVGVVLAFPSLRILGAALWLILVMYVWTELEERALLQTFGHQYEMYRKSVPRLLGLVKATNGVTPASTNKEA